MASRFWVGGTGTWDASATTHWASTSGGASGASVPTTGDDVIFDGSSGGGTVTLNTILNIGSITCGAFTGTLALNTNNNTVSLTGATGFNCSGTGTRTITVGSNLIRLTNAASVWDMTVTTNLTFTCGTGTVQFTGIGGVRTFNGGGQTYANVTFAANTAGVTVITGANTIGTLTLSAGGGYVVFPSGVTQTLTNAPTMIGTALGPIGLAGSTRGTQATLSCGNNISPTWTALRDIACTGAGTHTASNSLDLGNNSGITITAPSVGGGGGSGIPMSRVQLGM